MKDIREIREVFHKDIREMGISDNFLGEECFYLAMDIIRENPLRLCCISKSMYFDIADKLQTNPACVERNFRTFISKLWNTDDHKYLDKIAGCRLAKKPSNKEFLDIMMVYWNQE